MYRAVLARDPRPEEVAVLMSQVRGIESEFSDDAATKLVQVGQSRHADSLNATELAVYTTVASALLNLDEAMTRE